MQNQKLPVHLFFGEHGKMKPDGMYSPGNRQFFSQIGPLAEHYVTNRKKVVILVEAVAAAGPEIEALVPPSWTPEQAVPSALVEILGRQSSFLHKELNGIVKVGEAPSNLISYANSWGFFGHLYQVEQWRPGYLRIEVEPQDPRTTANSVHMHRNSTGTFTLGSDNTPVVEHFAQLIKLEIEEISSRDQRVAERILQLANSEIGALIVPRGLLHCNLSMLLAKNALDVKNHLDKTGYRADFLTNALIATRPLSDEEILTFAKLQTELLVAISIFMSSPVAAHYPPAAAQTVAYNYAMQCVEGACQKELAFLESRGLL